MLSPPSRKPPESIKHFCKAVLRLLLQSIGDEDWIKWAPMFETPGKCSQDHFLVVAAEWLGYRILDVVYFHVNPHEASAKMSHQSIIVEPIETDTMCRSVAGPARFHFVFFINVNTFLVPQEIQKYPMHPTHFHVIPPIDGNRRFLRLLNVMPPACRKIQRLACLQANLDGCYVYRKGL